MLRHELATDWAALEALTPEWDRLLASSRHNLVMRGPTWSLAWWRVFGGGEGRKARVVTFRRGSELVGVVPLLSRRTNGLCRLELFGTGEPECDEVCAEHLGFVVAPGEEQAVTRSFSALLRDDALGPWDQLDLVALSGDDTMGPLLCEALRGSGRLGCGVAGGAPFARLPSTWASYLSSLSSSQRQRVTRTLTAFERWTGGDHALVFAADQRELARGLGILERLHSERWQAEGRPGAFASPRFRTFHRLVAPKLFDRGELELGWLLVRGRPVAAVYNLLCNGAVRFYQSGRIAHGPTGVSLGIVTHLYAMQRAIAAQRSEYDFLGGVGRYKLELCHDVRPLLRLMVSRRSVVAELQRATRLAGRAIRFWRSAAVQGPPAEEAPPLRVVPGTELPSNDTRHDPTVPAIALKSASRAR